MVSQIAKQEKLPEKYRDHELTGNYAGFRECHIQPDWLLVYRIEEKELILFYPAFSMSMSFPIEVMQDGQIEMLCEQYRKEKKQRLREFRRIKRVFLINMREGKAFLIDALPFRIPFLMFFLLRV